jgi:hypothetical protein
VNRCLLVDKWAPPLNELVTIPNPNVEAQVRATIAAMTPTPIALFKGCRTAPVTSEVSVPLLNAPDY